MRYCIITLFLLPGSIVLAQSSHQVEVRASRFVIEGKTNVNTFDCALYQDIPEEKLEVQSHWTDFSLSFEGLRFRYRVTDFDCGLAAMNADMQELLKSKEYPYLFLEIHNINVDRSNTEIERLKVSAEITIMIAGVYRKYQIMDGLVINRSEQELTFLGKKTLKLTDFNLEPPTKFFGMVTVTDELKVEFELHMHVDTLK